MATDSTILPQGEAHLDAGMDTSGSDLDLTAVQLAASEPAKWVDLPQGNVVILLPVQPGQTVRLPTDSAEGLPVRIGPEGNLAIVVDGRTIILQGYLKANDQSPVKIVTSEGDPVDVAELIAATDPGLDIVTAAGPATGGQGDGPDGSGIYIPFGPGPGLDGLNALGVLDPTALQYRLIDDEPELFVEDEDGHPLSIEIVPDDGRPTTEDGAFLLDEDFLKSGNKDATASPGDDDGSNTSSGTVVVNFGPDGPRAVNPIVMTGVVNGSESGLYALTPGSTAQGAPILLQLDPPAGGQQVLTGYVGGTVYFTITLNTTTGHFEIEQFEPFWHPDTGSKDLGFEDNVLFKVVFTAYDADGDSISATLHLSFDDDMPEIVRGEGTLTLAMDESISFLQKDYDDPNFPNDGVQDGSAIEGDALFHLFPGMGLPNFPIGWASGNVSGLFAVSFGADGEHSLTYALTITNPITDLKDTLTGETIKLIEDGGIIKGVTETSGLLVFAVALNPTTGQIVSTMYRAIDHGDEEGGLGAHDEVAFLTQGTLGVTATAVDGDGDTVSKTIDISGAISFDDDGPKFIKVFWGFDGDSTHAINGVGLIDEDALKGGNPGGPGDQPGGKSADGQIFFDFGSDGFGSMSIDGIKITDSAGTVVAEIDQNGDFVAGGLKTADGRDIEISKSGPDGNGVITWTGVAVPGGQTAFTFTLDTAGGGLGQFQFTLHLPLEHPFTDPDSKNDGPQTAWEDNLKFDIAVRGTDGDGDSAIGHIHVQVNDDSPKVLKGTGTLKLQMDETVSLSLKDYDDPNFPNDGKQDGSAIEGDALLHQFPGMGLPNFPIGWASGNVSGLFSVSFGADGPGSVTYALTVLGSGITTLKDTLTGETIKLVNDGGVINGVTETSGHLVFAVAVNPNTGQIVSTMYRAIDHGNEEGGLGAHDEVAFLTQGTLGITATATDADGDSTSKTIDISKSISFDDDGPKFVKVFWGFDGDSTNPINGIGIIDEDALANGNPGGPGDDAGAKSTDGQIIFDFGSDGPGSISIDKLKITNHLGQTVAEIDGLGNITFGALFTADGQPVTVTVSVGAGGVITYQGVAGGEPVFTLTLDGAGANIGDFKFELHQPLQHPFADNPGTKGVETAYEDNLYFDFTVRGTDGDGDSALGNIKIRIDDDSPKVTSGEGSLTLQMDESVSFSLKDYDDPNFPNDGVKDGSAIEGDALFHPFPGMGLPNFPIGWASGNVSGLFSVSFGADGPGSVTYALTVLGSGVTTLKDTLTGETIVLVNDGGVIKGMAGGHLVFAVAVNPNSGQIVSTMYRAIDHGAEENAENDLGAHDEVAFLTQGTLGVTATATDADGDSHSKTIDISQSISFDDDGPKFVKVFWGFDGDSTNPINGVGIIDEDALKGGQPGGPGDDAGGKSTDGQIVFDFGSDGPGSISIDKLTIKNAVGDTVAEIGGAGGPLAGLKTADGQAIKVIVSVDAGTGVITYQGVTDPGDVPVFTLTLDGAGANIGDFKFELHQPLQHPFTDPDSKNDGPQTAYEDNLYFDFTVRGTDGDGDSALGNIKIRIDDDSPVATNDKDSVTEGAGNEAIGNVVTGANVTVFGSDANGTDGNKDGPGADQPYTISKIVHNGVTYQLSADGQSVSNLGPDDSFDPATGILKIKTAEGGTFEIVMISSNLSEVGDYRYTTGEPPHHDSDKFGGPKDLAESRSDAFDHVDEWTASFSAAGVTLVPVGGSLAIKMVDVAGPNDYRGIGVSSGSGDEVEVDNAGPDEKLELHFASKTNNATLTIGALFNGEQFDVGNQEILLWEAWDNGTLVGSGQIVGTNNGVAVLDIDTGVPFNKIVLTPVNNGAGENANNSDFLLLNVEICKQEDVKEKFDYTLRDADGDESTATLTIEVKDTQPTIPTQTPPLHLKVDEDGLPGGIGDNTSPNDDTTTNSATATGFIPFSAGADPVTIELSVGNGGDTGLKTLSGQAVFAAWDAATQTLIGYIAGTNPINPANQVFKLTVTDAQTGAVEFKLLKPIKHADGGQDDDTENDPDPYFTVHVQIEDKDCDVAFTTVKITIDDDMPVVHVVADSRGTTQHDETAGRQTGSGDDDQSGNPPALFNPLVALAGAPIGWAKDGDSAVNIAGSSYGADGPGTTTYGLKIPAAGTDSGVDTTDGKSIWLYEGPNGTIVGRVGDGANGETPNPSGAIAFAISIDGNGALTLVQWLSLKHPNPNDHDEDIGLNTGALQAVVTLTDADGDSVSGEANIGNLVRFDDDGPTAKLSLVHGKHVQHDETAGVQNPGDGDMDQPNGSLPAEFSGIVGTLIGWAKSNGSVVSTAGTSFGADDEGATKTLSLAVSFNGVDSGIDDTLTGQNIYLYQNGDIVEGRVGGAGGAVAFAISINQDGTLNVAQYRALKHPDTSSHDETIAISDSALKAVLTVIDGDGDKATASVNIGGKVRFDDDGPTANPDVDSVDEDSGAYAIGNVITGANVTSFGSDANDTDGVADDPGSDGLASIKWVDPAAPGGFDGNGNIVGLYGTLYVDADGGYKYVLDNNNPTVDALNDGQTLQEVFSYFIFDKDGDKAGSTLTITINGKTDRQPPEADVRIGAEGNTDVICVPEDTVSGPIPVVASTTPGSHLTTLVIGGFPTGSAAFTLDLSGLDTDGAGTDVVVDTSQLGSGFIVITFANNQTSYSGSFTVKAPADSDVDLGTLTAIVVAEDDVDPSLTDNDTDEAYVQVDAVADGSTPGEGDDGDADKLSVSLSVSDDGNNGTFSPGETGKLKVSATFDDYKDGSEIHTVTIDAPTGFKFLSVEPGSLPAGVIVQSITDGKVVLLVDSKDGDGIDGVGSFSNVTINIQNVGNDHGGQLSFIAEARAVEANLSGEECDTGNNVAYVQNEVDVFPEANFLPTAVDDSNTATNVDTNYQLMLVLDRSGSMDEIVPNSGGKTRFELARDALITLIQKYQGSTNGTVNIKLVLFNNNSDFAGGSGVGTFISADAAIAYLQGLSPTFGTNGTDYDAALWDALQGINDPSWANAGAGTQSFVYWVSDGRPTEVGNSIPELTEFPGGDNDNRINDAEQAQWVDGLNAKGVTSIAIGIGTDIVGDPLVADQLPRIAHNPSGGPEIVQIIDDINALTAALVATVPAPVSGNLLTNDAAGDPSDPLSGGIISIVDLADPDSPAVLTQNMGTFWKIETALGILEVVKATGAYTYTPKPGSEGKTDTFSYTIQDTIGPDQDTATLTIKIESTAQTIDGNDSANTLAGGLGNDTVNGKGGNDVLWGGEGDDTIDGGDGNDRIYGGGGNDQLKGGAHNDTYIFLPGDGKDTISDSGGTDAIHLLGGPTFLNASRSGNNLVLQYGLAGLTDQITITNHFNGSAVETITIIDGPFAGTYNLSTDSSSPVNGDSGNDILAGTGDPETFNGNAGNDLIFAGAGNDTVNGGSGHDYVEGGAGDDKLNGDDGNDTLLGGDGKDTLSGGNGNDYLDGGIDAFADVLNGGDGDDVLVWRGTADTYNGDGGTDTLLVAHEAFIDFTTVNDNVINNVERIDMRGGSGTTIKLNSQDLLDHFETGTTFNPVDGNVLPTKASIQVDGDTSDVLQLSSGAGQWVALTGGIGEPAGYKVYAFDTNLASGAQPPTVQGYVIVHEDITVQVVA